MVSQISHSFPILGQIDVPLHNESDLVFSLLEQFTSASLRHLQKLDHLGELRDVLKCGMHSRYEYLILQLYFIHYFKHNAKAFGLSSNVTLPSGRTVSSGEELLKCWALLEELGHLKGTYEAERFLLGVLTDNAVGRDFYLSSFKDPRGATFAKQTIESENLWQLHRSIAWLALEYHRDKKLPSKKEDINLLIEILFGLIVRDNVNPVLGRAQNYFSRIRRLAHLYLDTANLPTHFHFHPVILLQSFGRNPTSFITETDQVSNRLFGSLYDFLQDELYSSVAANTYKLDRYEGLQKQFAAAITDRKRSPIKSKEQFVNWIFGAKGSPFWGHRNPALRRSHQLRLRLVSDGYFEPEAAKILSEENEFKRTVSNDRWSIFLTSYSGPAGHSLFIDLFEVPRETRSQEGKVVTALIGLLERCHSSFASLDEVFLWLCDVHLSEVVRFILKRCFGDKFRFRFGLEGKFSEHGAILLKSRRDRTRWSRTTAWDEKKQNLSSERQWEVDCLRREVRKALGGMIVCLTAPVFVENPTTNNVLAEFDGVFIRVHGGRAEVTIVEAKTLRHGAETNALAELKAKMTKLGISQTRINRQLVRTEKSARIRLQIG